MPLHHDPELHHDARDRHQAPDLHHGPEAPVQLHEVLAVAVLDVEEREALEHDAADGEEETERRDAQVAAPESLYVLSVAAGWAEGAGFGGGDCAGSGGWWLVAVFFI